jgi:hypothetical protein
VTKRQKALVAATRKPKVPVAVTKRQKALVVATRKKLKANVAKANAVDPSLTKIPVLA